MLTSSRDKNEGTRQGWEGGGEPAMNPGSELLLAGSARVGARILNKGDKEKKRCKGILLLPNTALLSVNFPGFLI